MNTSVRQTAIYIALFSSLIVLGGVFSIVSIPHEENTYSIAVIATFLVFIIVYFICIAFLKNLIIKKINPIYKTIQNVALPQQEIEKDFEDPDVIKEVKKDVMTWARKKTLEISQLKQLEKFRRDFLGNVSHELKTPIFNIQGYVLTLLDRGLEDPSINRQYLERAEKSINRLISIVNDLESISRLESGEAKPDIKKFNLLKLVKESVEMHDMMASEKEIKLKIKKKSDDPLIVAADRKQILEVLNNLIVNSIKYGNQKGTTIIDFHDMDESILVEVSDNGPGISEKDLPRIFERFYRPDKSRAREMGGTGLGLSIVKHIIEAHGQTINVRSKKGAGSSFTFTLKKA